MCMRVCVCVHPCPVELELEVAVSCLTRVQEQESVLAAELPTTPALKYIPLGDVWLSCIHYFIKYVMCL